MKNFKLILNMEKKLCLEVAKKILDYLISRNLGVYLPQNSAKAIGLPELAIEEKSICPEIDCVIVLGGDGTLLNAARKMIGKDIPLLGVNLGQLGFLTELEPGNFIDGLNKLLEGQYHIEERIMLDAFVNGKGGRTGNFTALNDIVITKGAFARMIELAVYVGSEFVANYPADGLIISSPTGSTAYSLSAGGPIVAPELDVIIFTPICPHTLYARPIIIPSDKELKITVKSGQAEVMLTVDGQYGFQLQEDDIISVTKSKHFTKLVKLKGRSFYSVLREKLRDGER